jgi:hypothetical protein
MVQVAPAGNKRGLDNMAAIKLVRTERIEIVSLKIAMIQRGIDAHDLAKMAKLGVRNVQNILSGTFRRKPLLRIEEALGISLISTPAKLQERLRQKATAPLEKELSELRHLVEQANLSAGKLAEMAGINPKQVLAVLNGTAKTRKAYYAVEKALGVPIFTPPQQFYAAMRETQEASK